MSGRHAHFVEKGSDCKNCGAGVEESWAKCPYCGNDNQVLSVVILFKSCAVGLANSLRDTGNVSGSIGFIVTICFLTAGIVGVVDRNSKKQEQ